MLLQTPVTKVYLTSRETRLYLVQDHVSVLIHIPLVHQLLQQHSGGHERQTSVLPDVLVQADLIPDQLPQRPALHIRDKLGHALGGDAAGLRADDVAVDLGLSVSFEDELRHLCALPAARGAFYHSHLETERKRGYFEVI